MDEDFFRQTRRFSAAILTDYKGKRSSMAGKRLARRRAAVVNTGSKSPLIGEKTWKNMLNLGKYTCKAGGSLL